MRACAVPILSLALALSALSTIGCVERDPFSASDVAEADAFHRAQAAAALRHSGEAGSGGRASGTVRCRCDAEGGLHVTAPQGSTVELPPGAFEDAEADITLPERRPGTPIRRTVSLGFVGDGKLTQIPSRGGPWNVPDALLPAHSHGQGSPSYGYRGGGYYRGYSGYAGRGYTGSSRGSSGGGSGGGGFHASGGHNLPVHAPRTSMASFPRGGGGGAVRTGGSGHIR